MQHTDVTHMQYTSKWLFPQFSFVIAYIPSVLSLDSVFSKFMDVLFLT